MGTRGAGVRLEMGRSGRATRAMPTSQNRDMGHPATCHPTHDDQTAMNGAPDFSDEMGLSLEGVGEG